MMTSTNSHAEAIADQPRWSRRPEGFNWGDFGADDQLGRLNLITPQRRMAAAMEVGNGEAFALSLPLDLPPQTLALPFREPPHLSATAGNNRPFAELLGATGAIDIAAQRSDE